MDTVLQSERKLKLPFSLVLITAMLLAGFALRTILSESDWFPQLLPWLSRVPTNVYYADSSGRYLIPQSQKLKHDDSPQVLVQLLIQPGQDTALASPLPSGTTVRGFTIEHGTARIDLSAAFVQEDISLSAMAVIQTLESHPDIRNVEISVEGAPITTVEIRTKPIFYVKNRQVVAIPSAAATPDEALAAYLTQTSGELVGLPTDVQLISYNLNSTNGLMSLYFTYTDSLREFAVGDANAMQGVLVGLIATMTSFPEVEAVMLDFEGHSQLGLGQCADLLRAPQTHPTVFNVSS